MHSEGVVDVAVERDGERDVLTSAYTYTCPAPTGTSLFLMLNMAGALGGCIHAMRSLYWYAGQRELKWSWLPMYFALPVIGSAMATIFSLLIVGLTATINTVSPTSITVQAPPHAAGEVDVEVKSGNQSVKLPTKFTYTALAPE